jgi:hypothetical protein
VTFSPTARLAVLLPLALAACSYEPPNAADSAKPTYQADLIDCRAFGVTEGHRLAVAYGGLFLSYPISLPIVEWRQMRKCMARRGYVASN